MVIEAHVEILLEAGGDVYDVPLGVEWGEACSGHQVLEHDYVREHRVLEDEHDDVREPDKLHYGVWQPRADGHHPNREEVEGNLRKHQETQVPDVVVEVAEDCRDTNRCIATSRCHVFEEVVIPHGSPFLPAKRIIALQ